MKETRKKITLPSGGTCSVRRLTANDFAITEGEIPVFVSAENDRPERTPQKRSIETGVRFIRVALLRCVSPITTSEGKRLRIVEKDLDQATDSEITIGEMTDEDAQCIMDAVVELSGLGKEASQDARTFPEEPEAAGSAGQLIEAIRNNPDGLAGSPG